MSYQRMAAQHSVIHFRVKPGLLGIKAAESMTTSKFQNHMMGFLVIPVTICTGLSLLEGQRFFSA